MVASDKIYLELQREVDNIIDEFGTEYTVNGEGTFDEAGLETLPGSSRSVFGVIADQETVLQINSGEANWNAKRTLILKADSAPVAGEEVEIENKCYSLSKLVPIKPARIVISYLLDISR